MKIEKMPLSAIRELLHQDGYAHLAPRAKEVQQAAAHGCLLWTREKIVTTDISRIHSCPK